MSMIITPVNIFFIAKGGTRHSDGSDSYSGSPDLNLHTLIDSVERDIELLEQLETCGSKHLSYDGDNLPISANLLNLPGYKPRLVNNGQQQSKYFLVT